MSSDPSSPSASDGSPGKSPTIPDAVSTPKVGIDTKTIVGAEAITASDEEATANQIGATIGKYEIRAQLGAGGMGAVYLAFDPLIEREVAIKVLSQDVAASKIALQRFLQEARSIGRLNHPNVVSIFDIDQWNGQYYLVMELLSGGSLAELVDKHGPVPWPEACRLIAQAALGLESAHAAGMIHRDIKPENLMQTKDGIVKVVDFGLSKLTDAANDTRTAVTKQGQILGTPQYMSPEQFESIEVDSRTDIYSLGASLFRLLSARFPYHDCASIVQTMMAHLNKPPPKATDFHPEIPIECDRIIARAMAKSPDDRYQKAYQLADDLIALIQKHGGAWSGASPSAMLSSEANRSVSVSSASLDAEPVKLRSVVIVESSRMLAAMMKDAVVRAGATHVEVMSAKDPALKAIQNHAPDLLITAMQLPDGLGLDLIRDACLQVSLSRTCLVLNSNDSTIEELIGAGSVASRVLVPKKIRPDDMLRMVHAAGPIEIDQGPIAEPLDAMNLRLVLMTDFGKAPDDLAELIRAVGLLDVAVIGLDEIHSIPGDDVPTVVLRVPKTIGPNRNSEFYSRIAAIRPDTRLLLGEIEVDGPKLKLRSLDRQGMTAAIQSDLDARRLTCLLQACRLS